MKEVRYLKSNIRMYREKAGMSRKTLAKKTGLSVYSIIDIELARSYDIKLTTLIKIAKSLNLTIAKLLLKPKQTKKSKK